VASTGASVTGPAPVPRYSMASELVPAAAGALDASRLLSTTASGHKA
jgi:hypothetical protein